MSRVSINYGNASVFVGPSVATGHHFLTYSGRLNSDHAFSPTNRNLIADIARVQEISYDINVSRNPITHLSKSATVATPIINHPNISIGFSYCMMGLKNEARLGLEVNYAQFHEELSGVPYFPNNTGVNLLSGLISRDITQPSNDPFWPPRCREPKNLFLAISKSGEEIENPPYIWYTGDNSIKIDNRVKDWDVIGFGNCYLTSYSARGVVGSPPMASVRFTADNISFYSSGSGGWIPAINPRDRKPISGRHFNIPSYYPHEGPACLKPGDIQLDLVVNRSGTTGTNYDIDFVNNMWIDGFSLGFELQRENLDSLGFKAPIDRPIVFPTFVNLEFEATVNEHQTGNLVSLINHDLDYNITIKMLNPNCPNEVLVIPPYKAKAEAVRFDFVKAKFQSMAWSDSIGSRKRASFSFLGEISPDDFTKGFFVSGLLNIAKVEEELLYENTFGSVSGDGEFLLTESGKKICVARLPIVN